jgi:hypothetical protein
VALMSPPRRIDTRQSVRPGDNLWRTARILWSTTVCLWTHLGTFGTVQEKAHNPLCGWDLSE